MTDSLKLAFGTLSVLPAGMPSKVDRVVAGRAMMLAPVVGLVLGGIAAGVVAGVDSVRPDAPLLSAVLGLVVLTVLSGALHLDGLADTADGFGSRRDRETMLRIMKQSDIGPFGVASILGVLLIDVAALTACVQAGFGWQAILLGAVTSRLALPWSCRTTVPSARPDGLGAMVAATVRPLATYALTLPAILFATALGWLAASDLSSALAAGLSVLVAVGVGAVLTHRAETALGGITGDTLGAAVELALPATLLTLALTT